MLKFAVMVGNPESGFFLHGPFNSEGEAEAWAQKNCEGWQIMPMEPPE